MVRLLSMASINPPGPVDDRDVPDADLILEDDEGADNVTDKVLRSEANGKPDDPGAGEHRVTSKPT